MEHQQPKSVKQQVESLCKRGMALDENRATETLSQVSYFRLKLKASYSQNQKKTPYFTICNMVYLCNAVRPDNHVKSNIMSLIAKSSSLNLRRWGFIDGWEEEPLWK